MMTMIGTSWPSSRALFIATRIRGSKSTMRALFRSWKGRFAESLHMAVVFVIGTAPAVLITPKRVSTLKAFFRDRTIKIYNLTGHVGTLM